VGGKTVGNVGSLVIVTVGAKVVIVVGLRLVPSDVGLNVSHVLIRAALSVQAPSLLTQGRQAFDTKETVSDN